MRYYIFSHNYDCIELQNGFNKIYIWFELIFAKIKKKQVNEKNPSKWRINLAKQPQIFTVKKIIVCLYNQRNLKEGKNSIHQFENID